MKSKFMFLVLVSMISVSFAQADQCQALTKDQQIAAKGLIERSISLKKGVLSLCQNCSEKVAEFVALKSNGLKSISLSHKDEDYGYFEIKFNDHPNMPVDAAYTYVNLGIKSTRGNPLWHNLANLMGCRQTGASAYITEYINNNTMKLTYANGPINKDLGEANR